VSNMPSSQTKTYGVTLTLRSDTPTRTGYTFQGWSTSSGTSNTVNYAKSASYTTNASDVLYAVWKINACTITLNANGGTLGTTTSYTVDYGGTVSLWSASWATRTGYTFLGYSTDPNATTAEFLPRYTTNSNIYTITASDTWYAVWKVNTDIYPEFITPNATYYSGIDIIASFNIVNDGAIDFTQSSGIDVNLEVYSVSHSGISTLILDNEKSIVIPKYEENLVYWKVSIPTNSKQLKYVVTVSSNADETDFENNSKTYEVNVSTLVNSQTEDTIFENTPASFTLPSVNANISGLSIDDNATWQIWEWVDGAFKLNTYGIETNLNVTMSADTACKTEIINGSSITMKSGYGIQTEVDYGIENYSDYLMPSTDAYTEIQTVNMYFPEYMYSTSVDNYRTLELVGDSFYFEENPYTMTSLGATDNRRTHFIPIYFPDETYAVKTYGYNLWTPAGMINTVQTNTQIQINGDIFDDWVITR
ncbi:MAG: InlB B-repeat-containing protein, partial [Clostridia bacterium]